MAGSRGVWLMAGVWLAVGCGKAGGEVEEEATAVVLEVREAIFGEVPGTGAVALSLVDRQGACLAAQASRKLAGATSLSFALQAPPGGQIGPGTYPVWQLSMGIPTSAVALVDLSRADAECDNTLEIEQTRPVTGSVTLDSLDLQPGGVARGRYALQFASGPMAGEFEAAFCPLPAGFPAAALGCE